MRPPIDPLRPVTDPEPERLNRELASRGATFAWNDPRSCWVASRAESVVEVLAHPRCRTRPPREPVPMDFAGTQLGAIFCLLARMTDDEPHRRRKRALFRALATIPEATIRTATINWTMALPAPDDLARIGSEVAIRVLGQLLGVPAARLGLVTANVRISVLSHRKDRGQ